MRECFHPFPWLQASRLAQKRTWRDIKTTREIIVWTWKRGEPNIFLQLRLTSLGVLVLRRHLPLVDAWVTWCLLKWFQHGNSILGAPAYSIQSRYDFKIYSSQFNPTHTSWKKDMFVGVAELQIMKHTQTPKHALNSVWKKGVGSVFQGIANNGPDLTTWQLNILTNIKHYLQHTSTIYLTSPTKGTSCLTLLIKTPSNTSLY